MYPIVESRLLAPDIKLFRVVAPRIARKQLAGQFVIVRLHDRGERIPLTIAGSSPDEGTVTLIVQGVGKTTKLMNRLEAGDAILDVVGPLGHASKVKRYGTVVVMGGGVGTAIAYPVAKAMKEAGNTVVSIVGARSKEYVILETEVRATSDETFITTDDGSYGDRGFVTARLQALLDAGRTIDLLLAIGPVPMMAAVAEMTRRPGIKTIVSLNSIMVDGTGMCGGCRVITSGTPKFACVDGPEFDAHEVDFQVLARRNNAYRDAERQALAAFEKNPEAEVARLRAQCPLAAAVPEIAAMDASLKAEVVR
jgi:ferredoxin--NADP+ reductase